MQLFLWLASVILVIVGIAYLFRRQMAIGIALILIGLLVGPAGVSIVG